MNSITTRAWVEVDLGALLRNARRVMARARAPLLPMIKADAYGLGAVRVARALEAIEPWGFGVATVGEGVELREAGIERPIVIFTPLLAADLADASRARLTPSLGSRTEIASWAYTGLPWHLAVDTGMSRAGVPWFEVAALADLLRAAPPEGAFTHFHSAEREDGSRDVQERRFDEVIDALPVRPRLLHAENSPAVEHRAPSRWDVVRPGVFLYGVGSDGGIEPDPVVSLRARIVELRTVPSGDTVSYDGTWRAAGDRRIATLAIGYADGYRRALSNRGEALVCGGRAPVAGVVTMDMTMVDVTGIDCEVGDVATLIGAEGATRIDVADVARLGELSPYEVLTSLRGRLPRFYLPEPA